MSISNGFVIALLRSRWHRLMSDTTLVLRYTGPRSGRQITLPLRYAADGDHLLIAVGRPDHKTWWRSFRTDRDVEVLRAGRWTMMTARAVGPEQPAVVAPLFTTYATRFPRSGAPDGDGPPERRARRAVMVRCRRQPEWKRGAAPTAGVVVNDGSQEDLCSTPW